MSFGTAIDLIKKGYQVSREAWDNVEVYMYLDHDGVISIMIDGNVRPFIALVTSEDILTNDWYLLA